uniref:hypothetical protein n=1 Tax=Rhodococcus sp. MSC1_016 TaxID=2909266 RepID=UPI00202ED9CF
MIDRTDRDDRVAPRHRGAPEVHHPAADSLQVGRHRAVCLPRRRAAAVLPDRRRVVCLLRRRVGAV